MKDEKVAALEEIELDLDCAEASCIHGDRVYCRFGSHLARAYRASQSQLAAVTKELDALKAKMEKKQ